MPQCVSEMVQVSNFYLQRGAAKILNKALLKFGRKPNRYAPRPQLQDQLEVPEVKLKSFGERNFGFSAPTEWNKLPVDVKSALTLESFKAKLKTYLYKICYK